MARLVLAAFAALASMGIRTLVSMDGARPDVDGARRHGLRYVHIPVGYSGMEPGSIAQLAAVAEAAVVGRPHEIKGQAVAAFVTLKEGGHPSESLMDELKEHVVRKIGALARPDQILFAADLPKTRSGKIMRRLLRNVAEDESLGDTTTLADPGVVAGIRDRYLATHSGSDEG